MTELDRVRAERNALNERMAEDPRERTYENFAIRQRLDARIDALLNGKPRAGKRELPQRHCDSCGRLYRPTRIDNVYCSTRHASSEHGGPRTARTPAGPRRRTL